MLSRLDNYNSAWVKCVVKQGVSVAETILCYQLQRSVSVSARQGLRRTFLCVISTVQALAPGARSGKSRADVGCRARRYRKFKIGEEMALVVRCELDGVLTYKGEELLLSIKALNEFDPKVTGASRNNF